jgi:hypothetical protein
VRGVSKNIEAIENLKKKRVVSNPYKTKVTPRMDGEAVIVDDELNGGAPEGYFVTKDHGVLPLTLQAGYLFYYQQKAPTSFTDGLEGVASLTNKAKAEMKYF